MKHKNEHKQQTGMEMLKKINVVLDFNVKKKKAGGMSDPIHFTYDLNLLNAYTCVKVCKDTTLTSSVASGGRARSKIRTPYRVRICRIFSLLL